MPANATIAAAAAGHPQALIPASLDVLYTWVDGTWPDYTATQQAFTTKKPDLNPERFCDPHDLLRHSLRSLERFCPWVGNIVLFTMRPQVPRWLRRDHPKVRIVHHDEVIDPSILPTFNGNTIESHLHLIPGLGPRFLYLNDDFLFGRATAVADFFAPDGRIKVFGSLLGEHSARRIFDGKNRPFSLGFIEHAPILVDRGILTEAIAVHHDEIQATRRQRFRADDQVRTDFLYRYHLLAHCRRQAVLEPFWRLLRYHRFHKIENNPSAQRRAFDKLRRLRPKFYCLNNDQGDTPHPGVNTIVGAFLRELYPTPSSFENAP